MAPTISLTSKGIVFKEFPDGGGWSACALTPSGRLTATGASMDEAREALRKLLNASIGGRYRSARFG